MLMEALHASRRRQAERELHYYRHLVDRNASGPSLAESSKPVANQSPPRPRLPGGSQLSLPLRSLPSWPRSRSLAASSSPAAR
jgi:hypothetical protein